VRNRHIYSRRPFDIDNSTLFGALGATHYDLFGALTAVCIMLLLSDDGVLDDLQSQHRWSAGTLHTEDTDRYYHIRRVHSARDMYHSETRSVVGQSAIAVQNYLLACSQRTGRLACQIDGKGLTTVSTSVQNNWLVQLPTADLSLVSPFCCKSASIHAGGTCTVCSHMTT
jgi:hypothetical protein